MWSVRSGHLLSPNLIRVNQVDPEPELAKYFQPDTGPYLVFGLLGLTRITNKKDEIGRKG